MKMLDCSVLYPFDNDLWIFYLLFDLSFNSVNVFDNYGTNIDQIFQHISLRVVWI